MAENTLTTQQNAFKTPEGTFDPAAFKGWVDQQAANMGVKGATTLPTEVSSALTGPVGAGFRQQWETQQAVLAGQADKAKQAFQIQGQGFSNYMQGLDTAKKNAGTRNKQVDEMIQQGLQKAEQFVADAKTRAADVMTMLDNLKKENMAQLDKAKAHDMVAGVQSFLAGLKQSTKQFMEQYGDDPAMKAYWEVTKNRGLQEVRGGVQSVFQNSLNNLLASSTAAQKEAALTGNQYVGYNEQNYLQTHQIYTQLAATESARRLDADLAFALSKGTAYENLANWTIATPELYGDFTPQLSYLVAKEAEAAALASAEKIAEMQTAGPGAGNQRARVYGK